MRKQRKLKLVLASLFVLVLAGAAGAQYLNLGWSGIRIGDPQDLSDGTTINLLEVAEIEFTADQSGTASVDAGTNYYVGGLAWKTCTTDPGLTTAAVSGGTLTVTTAASTTGTVDVLLLGHP